MFKLLWVLSLISPIRRKEGGEGKGKSKSKSKVAVERSGPTYKKNQDPSQ